MLLYRIIVKCPIEKKSFPSHCKCRHSFVDISLAESKHQTSITRNYFGTSHGKGPCGGLGGIVKRKVTNAVLQDNDLSISNAAEMKEFCESNLSDVGSSTFNSRKNLYAASTRSFKTVENIDHSQMTTAKTLSGCRKLHSIGSTGVGFQLKTRYLSCYSEGCQCGYGSPVVGRRLRIERSRVQTPLWPPDFS